MKDGHKDLGREGEEVALRDYLKRDYRLVERNWSVRQGEIDLIVRKGDTLVFVEVKTSDDHSPFHPLENVTLRKQKKLSLLIELYLSMDPPSSKIRQMRCDAAQVIRDDSGTYSVTIVPNILED